jgi:hypothetical protein
MKAQESQGELVAVWLQEEGQGKPAWGDHIPLEYLPPAPPLAQVGDVLLLPRNVTGDTKEQAFAWGGTFTPFRVIERTHAYSREKGEKLDPRNVTPARYMRSMLLVRRLTQDEYYADPQTLAG